MGMIQHDALIVTVQEPYKPASPTPIEQAHALAVRLYATIGMEQLVSPVVRGVMNGYASFFIAPDGSKEGWDDSNKSDQIRALFKQELRAEFRHCDCVSVSFGEFGTSASSE
jgi:hypothetical protein